MKPRTKPFLELQCFALNNWETVTTTGREWYPGTARKVPPATFPDSKAGILEAKKLAEGRGINSICRIIRLIPPEAGKCEYRQEVVTIWGKPETTTQSP